MSEQFQLTKTGRGSGSRSQKAFLLIFKSLLQSGIPLSKARYIAFQKVYSTAHERWKENAQKFFRKPSIKDAIDAMVRDLLEQSGVTEQKVAEKLRVLMDSESEDISLKTVRTILELKGELGAGRSQRLRGEIQGEIVDFEEIVRKAIKGLPVYGDNGQITVGENVSL